MIGTAVTPASSHNEVMPLFTKFDFDLNAPSVSLARETAFLLEIFRGTAGCARICARTEFNDARVAKLADAPDLGSGGAILRGSSPLPGIERRKQTAEHSVFNAQR